VVSVALRTRIVIPAPRFAARETLLATAPFFLRDTSQPPVAAGPALLSFEGADFMQSFLGVAGGAPLPRLPAWRDWAEPPAAMLDITEAPLYPASITRAPPLAIEPEPGTADGVPPGDPPWLRKLYLPLHLRFTIAAFEMVCQAAGWPRLDTARVTGSGLVVRRLAAGTQEEHWEDWITSDGKRGIWLELSGGPVADPEALPATCFGIEDAILRTRLGMSASAPLPTRLDSARLRLLPATVAGAAKHCSLYGVVPVFSSAEQGPDAVTPQDSAAIAAALAQRVRDQLTADWTGAATLRQNIAPALRTFLTLTILPAPPDTATATDARKRILDDAILVAPTTPAELDASLDAVVLLVLRDAAAALVPSGNDAAAPPAVGQFWAGARTSAWTGGTVALQGTFAGDAPSWLTLINDRLNQAVGNVLLPAGTPGSDAAQQKVAQALLGLALLRLRRFRLGLLVALHKKIFDRDDAADLTATYPDGGVQVPVATAASASPEIEAVYGLDDVKSPPEAVPPWSPIDRSQPPRADDVHRAALALERILTPVDAAGGAGGSQYEPELSDRITQTVAPSLAQTLGLTGDSVAALRRLGLDLFEQPARGLLVFPGATPDDPTLAAMAATIAARYTAASGLPAAVTEARADARVHRLRFDHDHLYAVRGWVRVAGRTPCELERVIWTERSEPFAIAEPTDILGAKPVTIQMPDLPRLIRDIPRIAKAGARPFAAFSTPANSGFNVSDDPKKTSRAWGVGWICSFGIPVLTICAYILFLFIFSILILIPGFAWMLLLKFCIPIPVPKKG
jgi:hypothetical protein